jgi:hypothetical protein
MFGLLDGATELKDATVARDHGANAGTPSYREERLLGELELMMR